MIPEVELLQDAVSDILDGIEDPANYVAALLIHQKWIEDTIAKALVEWDARK